ncbi:unnamed protein product [Mytilus coruscus]|uniref:Reverse transcriptase domain-containing protein n=1 Tax=Mytilus coruscus TaxID=42192 RepID=A0A6J8F036_MYTCO|nr:unnamed protein product [Mytilus coruscus]
MSKPSILPTKTAGLQPATPKSPKPQLYPTKHQISSGGGETYSADPKSADSPIEDNPILTESTPSPVLSSLNLLTFNTEGFNSNKLYLETLSKRSDILFLQEHWLHSYEKHKLDEFLQDFICYTKYFDDNLLSDAYERRRGHAGVAICIHKKFEKIVELLPDGAIELLVSKSKCIISNYLTFIRESTNTSTHDPILTTIPCNIQANEETNLLTENKRINWNKVDKTAYQEEIENKLSTWTDEINLNLTFDNIPDKINELCSIMATSASKCSRSKSSKYSKRLQKKSWTPELDNIAKTNRDHFAKWKAAGRPTDKIRKKRDPANTTTSSLTFNDISLNNDNLIRDAWMEYFQDLATPMDSENCDKEHFNLVKNDIKHLTKTFTENKIENISPVTEVEMKGILVSMKNNKSADEENLAAEHLKYGGPIMITIMTFFVNAIFKHLHIPTLLKGGIAYPILKNGKPKIDPNSYRKITITSTVGKVVEKAHLSQNKNSVTKNQNKLQKGFNSGEMPIIAALILTELIIQAIKTKSPLYVALMGARKAFDIVWHLGLMREMHKFSLTGDNWLFFKKGACIGPIYCGIPTVADDVALISTDPYELQTMLNVQADHANKLRCILSEQKSTILVYNDKLPKSWSLNGKSVTLSESAVHLGIERKYNKKYWGEISSNCPLCNIEPEDVTHFILKCEKLSSIRNRFIQELKSFLVDCNKPSLLVQELFDDVRESFTFNYRLYNIPFSYL